MVKYRTQRGLRAGYGRRFFWGRNTILRQAGFTYLGLLFAVALAGIALAGTGVLWQLESRREKEKELLFIGEQYRQAITSYYDRSPGSIKQYPAKLEEMLEDKRFPKPLRHLRRLYRDPMTADGDWVLILQQDRITGVASRSQEKPVKIGGFPIEQQDFEGAERYTDWRFVSNGSNSAPAVAARGTP